MTPVVSEVDAFDLPEWLGEGEVVWSTPAGVRGSGHVPGVLTTDGGAEAPVLACDLLAADTAYPVPVLEQQWRRAAHQQWTHGQVLLLEYDDRLTLAVPGTDFSADRVLESLTRLAKAVGADPSRFVAALRL